MMAELEAPSTKLSFLVHLSESLPPSANKSKGRKSAKDAKTKELEMEASDTPENYVAFLTGLLSKFGETSDFITDNNTFPFKYFHSSSKKGDAITVENHQEYKEMIEALKSLKISKPKGRTNVLVDMENVRICQPSSVSNLCPHHHGSDAYMCLGK